MALIKCKDCKQEISSAAKACPHCGKPVPHIDPGDVLKVVVGLLIAWGIYHVFSSSSDSPSAPMPPAPPAASAPAPPLAPREPSFDCNNAHSQSERLICADVELSALDADFGMLYKKAKSLASDKTAFVRANRSEWQRRENTCFDKACLIDWYAQRKLELSKVIANGAAPLNDYSSNGSAHETVRADSEKESLVAAVQRVRAVVTRYANRKGETELEFYDRINTPLADVAAFALTVEHLGGTIEGAVQSLDGLSNALQNPDKVKLLECMGIEVYVHPTAPPPSAMECKQVEQRLGIRRAANSE